ncbi:MAG: hypothetical protein HOC05_24960, partial [Gemmatimonadetes bacterium]|nr:hypothetical protein [Gemmatimonadota bacterium]
MRTGTRSRFTKDISVLKSDGLYEGVVGVSAYDRDLALLFELSDLLHDP